jgi:hypothetical protein
MDKSLTGVATPLFTKAKPSHLAFAEQKLLAEREK